MKHLLRRLWQVLAWFGLAAVLGLPASIVPHVAADDDFDLLAFEMRWSPDGRWLGVGSFDGAWIFDAQDFDAEPYHYQAGKSFYVVAFDPVRPYAAFASEDDDAVQVVEITTGKEIFRANAFPSYGNFSSVFYDLGYSNDGRVLAAANTAMLYVLDAETGAEVFSVEGAQPDPAYNTSAWITALDFDSQSTRLTTTNSGGDVVVYPLRLPNKAQTYTPDLPYIDHFETIPRTGIRVMLQGRALHLYDLETLTTLTDPEQMPLHGFDLHPDKKLVAAGSDGQWYLYDLDERTVLQTFVSDFAGDDAPLIYALAFNPAGTQVATLQTDGQFQIWDIASGEVIARLGKFTRGVSQRWG
jgi:WD40 repeat protein